MTVASLQLQARLDVILSNPVKFCPFHLGQFSTELMLLGISTLAMFALGYVSFSEASARQTSATAEPIFLLVLGLAAIQLISLIVRVLTPEEAIQVAQRSHERKPPQE